jgi:hypothetical protein
MPPELYPPPPKKHYPKGAATRVVPGVLRQPMADPKLPAVRLAGRQAIAPTEFSFKKYKTLYQRHFEGLFYGF